MSSPSENLTVVSPELVLVAPADLAASAREALPAYPPFPPITVAGQRTRDLAFVAFTAVCLLGTLGPLLLAIALTR